MNASKNFWSALAYFIVGIIVIVVVVRVVWWLLGLALSLISFLLGVAIVIFVGWAAYALLKALLKSSS